MEASMIQDDVNPAEEEILFSDEEATIDESLISGIPPEERLLRTQAYDKSVSDVVSMIGTGGEGDIILNPDYQRNYVWDNKKASLLIESLLLNVPIPVIYMAENDDSTWSVVDGLQRLESLRRFFANEFKLRGLEVLQELNGDQYSTLNPKAARILRNGILRIILVFKESHPDIKYEIFIRLNRGSIRLTDQELRNCLYRGKFNESLKHLRENAIFLKMMGLSAPHKRMNDAGLILRYFTISENFDFEKNKLVDSYAGKIISSMNKYINSRKDIDTAEINILEKKFITTAEKAYSVFGKNAFRKINIAGEFEKNLNRAIMDIVMVSFEHIDAEKLIKHQGEIISLLKELPQRDTEFNNALIISTSDKKQVEYRLSTWCRELNSIVQ